MARTYALIYGQVKDRWGMHLPGLGFALRRVRTDRNISVQGRQLWFNHKVAPSYARLVTGMWNEPETHYFFNLVIPSLSGTVAFIDVGANVGEMLVDVSRYANVETMIAFEPLAEHCRVIHKSLELNQVENYQVVERLVGATSGIVSFFLNSNSQTSSVVASRGKGGCERFAMTTLDAELKVTSDHAIVIVDVEGYEPQVLKGGQMFIRTRQPLIVFEYNWESKRHFGIREIVEILGDGYRIYRLRQDGRLDADVEHAWNCVAVPQESMFREAVTVVAGQTYP